MNELTPGAVVYVRKPLCKVVTPLDNRIVGVVVAAVMWVQEILFVHHSVEVKVTAMELVDARMHDPGVLVVAV